jgi:hypothetical protein
MKTTFRWIAAIVSSLLASAAIAEFHTYQIEQIYSNASGTVQFIVMHESQGQSQEYFWAGNKISSSVPMSYTFPSNLPVGAMCGPYGCGYAQISTAGTRVLIATQGFADLGILAPDFVIPNGFLSTAGGTLNYAGVDQVTYGALPSDGVNAVNRSGARMANLATNFAGNSASVAAPSPSAIDLNQHGLTGSWFKQATSGQGLEVEVYPDRAPGTGALQVSWFTYDSVSGGADHQRWYTLAGPAVSGQPTAALTIFQNVGGNFNAAPITNAQAVGTATLSFDTCSSGQLSYQFTDGSGRSGTIALTRLTQNVTCSTTSARPTNADFALSGNWYNATTSGQGITVEVNPTSATVFIAWYTSAPNAAAAGAAGQRWYTAQPTAAFAPGMRTIPLTLFQTTGGTFDAPTAVSTVPVGTATLAFQSCTAASLNYSFTGGSSNGLSGTIALTRVGPLPPGCTS